LKIAAPAQPVPMHHEEFAMHIIIKSGPLAAAIGLCLASASGHADTVTLPLGTAGNIVHTGDFIESYFSGGTDSTGESGSNLGISFSNNVTAQKAGNNNSTGNGKFENNPSHASEVIFASSSYDINDAGGFSGLAFNYAFSNNNLADSLTATLYSGLNGTGTALATFTMSSTGTPIACATGTNAYCTWSGFSTGGTNFGAADSVVLSGNVSLSELDGLVFTTPSTVPLPATAWLMLGGLAGFAGVFRRRSGAAA
jgi:hypothetical protein